MDSKLINDHEVGQAGNSVPAPLGSVVPGESGKETGQDHDEVSYHGDENVGTTQASKESQIQKQKWSGDTPVNVTGPVDLTVNILGNVGNVLVGFLDGGV